MTENISTDTAIVKAGDGAELILNNSPVDLSHAEFADRLEAIARDIEVHERARRKSMFRIAKLVSEAHDLFKYRRNEGGFAGWMQPGAISASRWRAISTKPTSSVPTSGAAIAIWSSPTSNRRRPSWAVSLGVCGGRCDARNIARKSAAASCRLSDRSAQRQNLHFRHGQRWRSPGGRRAQRRHHDRTAGTARRAAGGAAGHGQHENQVRREASARFQDCRLARRNTISTGRASRQRGAVWRAAR